MKEYLLRRVLDCVDDAVFVLGSGKPPRIEDCNAAASRVFGYRRSEMLGRTTGFLHSGRGSLTEFRRRIFPLLERGDRCHLPSFRMRRKNGREFPSEHFVSRLSDGWVSVVRDLSAQESAERNRREFEELVGRSQAMVFRWKFSGSYPVEFVSENVRRLGYTAEDFLSGRVSWVKITHPEDVQRLERELAAHVKARRFQFPMEYRLFDSSGRVHHMADVTHARRDAEGRVTHLESIILDVTDLKNIEEARRRFQESVSHELKTPLSQIKGFAETLRRGALDDPKHRLEFVRAIEAHADRMTWLINDLLDLSALEAGRYPLAMASVDLARHLPPILKAFAPTASAKRLRLLSRVPPRLRVRGDPHALGLLFENLLDNALKYTPKGGRIEVTARVKGDKAEVSVRDTGIGIPRKERLAIFERFHRAETARSLNPGGTGLGLCIVKQILAAHDGAISVENARGRGSVFRVSLPLT